jgi:uncharacterized protein (TIRG00374 family)
MRKSWRAALGVTLSAALLYWALKDVEWQKVIDGLRASNLPLWIAATVVSQLTFPLRAIRWRSILHPVVPDLPFGPLWRSTAIGMMVNNTALARAGEVVRAYALTREVPAVRFPTALASLVVDRAFDSVVVLGLLMVAILDPAFSASANVGDRTVGALAAVTGLFIVLFVAVFAPATVERLVAAIMRRVMPRWSDRVLGIVRSLTSGLAMLRSPRLFASVFVLTLVGWLVNAASFWLGFEALGVDVPLTAVLLVQGLIVISVALPQAPGFFGVW